MSAAIDVLSSQAIVMGVIYVSGITMLLLAVLYASASSRRSRARPEGPVREAGANLIQNVGNEAYTRSAVTAATDTTPGPLGIHGRFREIEDVLASLKGKLEALETGGIASDKDRADPGGMNCGSRTADLRRELEALWLEISGGS